MLGVGKMSKSESSESSESSVRQAIGEVDGDAVEEGESESESEGVRVKEDSKLMSGVVVVEDEIMDVESEIK